MHTIVSYDSSIRSSKENGFGTSENNIASKMSLPGVSYEKPIFPPVRQPVEKQDDLLERNDAQSMYRREQQTQSLIRDKEAITLRGNLEILENVMVDIVSELKYHNQQLSILSAEKDTTGAVIQMNIAQAKNSVLSEELKN